MFYDADEDETLDNETASLPTTASIHTSSMTMTASVRNSQVFDNDRLEKCGRWLSSIPRDDVIALRQTPEYEEFLQAFERLGHAHRRVITMNRIMIDLDAAMFDDPGSEEDLSETENQRARNTSFSFLQHLAVDDVILRIFEFLECQILSRTSETCSRFRELAHRSAAQRTQYVANTRQLNNAMQLLRAKEQIDGVGYSLRYCHVRVPMLLLSRRILVTDAGDPGVQWSLLVYRSQRERICIYKASVSGTASHVHGNSSCSIATPASSYGITTHSRRRRRSSSPSHCDWAAS